MGQQLVADLTRTPVVENLGMEGFAGCSLELTDRGAVTVISRPVCSQTFVSHEFPRGIVAALQLRGCSGADLLGQGFIASVRIMGALGIAAQTFVLWKGKRCG